MWNWGRQLFSYDRRTGRFFWELWRLRFSVGAGLLIIGVLDLYGLALHIDPRSLTALTLGALGKTAVAEAIGFSSWSAIHPYWQVGTLSRQEGMTEAQSRVVEAIIRSRTWWVVAWIIGFNLVP